mmetsp:Transcript_1436/g.880  ORF Transcript_1436/g.880 Transcript_1436/m.880 type:complete len:89 (-) Transcript_1436:37-303(-)
MATDPPPLRNGMTVFFFFFFFFVSFLLFLLFRSVCYILDFVFFFCHCDIGRHGQGKVSVRPLRSVPDQPIPRSESTLSQNGYGPPPAT